jgi:hypothetical protein
MLFIVKPTTFVATTIRRMADTITLSFSIKNLTVVFVAAVIFVLYKGRQLQHDFFRVLDRDWGKIIFASICFWKRKFKLGSYWICLDTVHQKFSRIFKKKRSRSCFTQHIKGLKAFLPSMLIFFSLEVCINELTPPRNHVRGTWLCFLPLSKEVFE